jgi:DNA-binding beta-propeller fold protein YncE
VVLHYQSYITLPLNFSNYASGRFNSLTGLAIDSLDNLYVGDIFNNTSQNTVCKINTNGIVTSIRSGIISYTGGIAIDSVGNLYVGNLNVRKVFKINKATGTVTIILQYIANLLGLAIDSNDNLYCTAGNAIIKINTSGNITYNIGISGGLASVGGVAVDLVGNLYITDSSYSKIIKVDTNGTITNPVKNYGTYGEFLSPTGIAVYLDGNIFIADCGNDRVAKIDRNGLLTSIASGIGLDYYVYTGMVLDSNRNIYVTAGDKIVKLLY